MSLIFHSYTAIAIAIAITAPPHGYISHTHGHPHSVPLNKPPLRVHGWSISGSALSMASKTNLSMTSNKLLTTFNGFRSATFTSARPVSNSVTPRGSCTFLHRLLTFRNIVAKIITHRGKANSNVPILTRYQLEHGLTPEGRYDESRADEVGSSGSYDTFYTETSGGKYVPRAIFADLDPSVWGKHIPRALILISIGSAIDPG